MTRFHTPINPKLIRRLPCHTEELVQYLNAPEVRTWMPSVDNAIDRDSLSAFMHESLDLPGWTDWTVIAGNDEKIVGQVTIAPHPFGISYWIAAPYQGQGLGMRSVAVALAHETREKSPGKTIAAEVIRENTASARILEYNGFIFSGLEQRYFESRRTTYAMLRFTWTG